MSKVLEKTQEDTESVKRSGVSDKAVVLLSGGVDSSTLLYQMAKGYEVWPMSIIYGQRHRREVQSAFEVCAAYSVALASRWKLIDLSNLQGVLISALTGFSDIPEGHYQDLSMRATVVPNRNMLLIAVAGGYALSVGAKVVAYAPHMGDHPVYPDCREAFIASAKQTLKLGTGWEDEGLDLVAPFSLMDKSDIVRIGSTLGVPHQLTWSCYKGGEVHCGVCGSCVERKEAFKLAGIKDPTQYLK